MPANVVREPEHLWQRVRDGQPAAVLGRLPDIFNNYQLVRVRCEVTEDEREPLVLIRRLLLSLLGEVEAVKKPTRGRAKKAAEPAVDEVLAELCDRLAQQAGPPCVVVLAGVEKAAPEVRATLVALLGREGQKLPLIFEIEAESESESAELLAAVRARGGEAAVVRREAMTAAELRRLPVDVVTVLRAGAWLGGEFFAGDVARVLGCGVLEVLERLQSAVDLGVAVAERGEGRFGLTESLVAGLAGSLMPSLAQAWDERLAWLAGTPATAPVAVVADAEAEPLGAFAAPDVGRGEVSEGTGAPGEALAVPVVVVPEVVVVAPSVTPALVTPVELPEWVTEVAEEVAPVATRESTAGVVAERGGPAAEGGQGDEVAERASEVVAESEVTRDEGDETAERAGEVVVAESGASATESGQEGNEVAESAGEAAAGVEEVVAAASGASAVEGAQEVGEVAESAGESVSGGEEVVAAESAEESASGVEEVVAVESGASAAESGQEVGEVAENAGESASGVEEVVAAESAEESASGVEEVVAAESGASAAEGGHEGDEAAESAGEAAAGVEVVVAAESEASRVVDDADVQLGDAREDVGESAASAEEVAVASSAPGEDDARDDVEVAASGVEPATAEADSAESEPSRAIGEDREERGDGSEAVAEGAIEPAAGATAVAAAESGAASVADGVEETSSASDSRASAGEAPADVATSVGEPTGPAEVASGSPVVSAGVEASATSMEVRSGGADQPDAAAGEDVSEETAVSDEELVDGDLEEVPEPSWQAGEMFVRGRRRPGSAASPPRLRPKPPRIASLKARVEANEGKAEAKLPTRNPALEVAARLKSVPQPMETPEVAEAKVAEDSRKAGDPLAAAEHYTRAAHEAAEMGAPKVALGHVQQALALLQGLPRTPERRRVRGEALLELGQLQWQSSAPELGFSLAQALTTLEAAAAELGSAASTAVAVQLCQAIAGVCFERGDAKSLVRALQELASASRMLLAEGDATGAARLLNDQAAVLVRMGDPVQALHLLRESRKVFQARSEEDPVALRELAETDHLFARLPLHAEMRAGRELEGYRAGLSHAQKAERAYRQLGDARELGRVWETMGRLELRMEQLETATKHLESAVDVQMQLGDLTGLARSTEALSEVLGLRGRDGEAINLLRESVQFNRNKGSPLGLSINRRVFTALVERLRAHPLHAPALHEVEVLLDAGERELGTIDGSASE